MKIYLIVILLAVLNNSILEASFDADSLFNVANREYSAEKYESAVRHYESISNLGFESAELYYNLANAYFKLANYPKSILNYERALLHDPHNDNIKFNLAKAQIYMVDQIDVIPEFIIKKLIRIAITRFHSNTWALISIFSFLLGISGFLVYFLISKPGIRRKGFYVGLLSLILSIASFTVSGKTRSILLKSNGAIVMTPSVIVKGSPSVTSTDLFIIHEGTKVYILDELNEWYEIKISDGNQGWLLKTDIEPI